MRFAMFPFHLSQVTRRPPESDAKSYKVLRLSRKIILGNLMIWCSKMQPFSGNPPSDLRTYASCTAPATWHASRSARFVWQAQKILHPATSEQNVNDGRRGHWKRIRKDAFRVASAIQQTCSSEMLGGQGADFLRRVAFWSIRSSGLRRWFCVTSAALCMTWHHFLVGGALPVRDGMEKSQKYWHEGVSSALNFPFLKEVSQNCFVFNVVKLKNWGRVAQNSFVFDVVKFKNWGRPTL